MRPSSRSRIKAGGTYYEVVKYLRMGGARYTLETLRGKVLIRSYDGDGFEFRYQNSPERIQFFLTQEDAIEMASWLALASILEE